MISTIIKEAIQDMQQWQDLHPAFYEDAATKTEIEDLIVRMKALSEQLVSTDGAEDLIKQVNPCKFCGKYPSVSTSPAYNRVEIVCAIYSCEEEDKPEVFGQDFKEAIEKWNELNPTNGTSPTPALLLQQLKYEEVRSCRECRAMPQITFNSPDKNKVLVRCPNLCETIAIIYAPTISSALESWNTENSKSRTAAA